MFDARNRREIVQSTESHLNQHDRSIDRLLRRTGAGLAGDAASGGCLDGERLAAWAAGTLRSATMVAAFARSEPVATAPQPWWTKWQVRWLVPLATAATLAAVWVAVPRDELTRQPVEQERVADTKVAPQLPSAPPETVKQAQPPPEAPKPEKLPATRAEADPARAVAVSAAATTPPRRVRRSSGRDAGRPGAPVWHR